MSGLGDIETRVAQAAAAAGRAREAISLIAVSKTQPEERILAVLQEGQRVFGENRVQEAEGRWPAHRAAFGPVELHLIGPLQTNKARAAVELFDVIHTVDRPRLVASLARLAQERGISPELFVQVNIGEESQKAGCLPQDVDSLVAQVRAENLPLAGLMCIPPAEDEPRPHFDHLARLAARNGLSGLSMGMSGDFEAAIAAGATHVRVGSAIFGDRNYG